jgi:hypothetical protein
MQRLHEETACFASLFGNAAARALREIPISAAFDGKSFQLVTI